MLLQLAVQDIGQLTDIEPRRVRQALSSSAQARPEQLHALWQDAVARSRALVTKALAGGGLEQPVRQHDQRSWLEVALVPGA